MTDAAQHDAGASFDVVLSLDSSAAQRHRMALVLA
jgi:hypothetical protein